MRKCHATQKSENQKTQSAIATLKTEKTNLHQHLLDLKRRVAELELMIGEEGQWMDKSDRLVAKSAASRESLSQPLRLYWGKNLDRDVGVVRPCYLFKHTETHNNFK